VILRAVGGYEWSVAYWEHRLQAILSTSAVLGLHISHGDDRMKLAAASAPYLPQKIAGLRRRSAQSEALRLFARSCLQSYTLQGLPLSCPTKAL
jgi:hypothetical protein